MSNRWVLWKRLLGGLFFIGSEHLACCWIDDSASGVADGKSRAPIFKRDRTRCRCREFSGRAASRFAMAFS